MAGSFARPFALGQEVMHRSKPATVQFIGWTAFGDGIWIGLEMEDSVWGKNDGSVKGRRYFSCRPGHGLFVRPRTVVSRETMPLGDTETKCHNCSVLEGENKILEQENKILKAKMSVLQKENRGYKNVVAELESRTLRFERELKRRQQVLEERVRSLSENRGEQAETEDEDSEEPEERPMHEAETEDEDSEEPEERPMHAAAAAAAAAAQLGEEYQVQISSQITIEKAISDIEKVASTSLDLSNRRHKWLVDTAKKMVAAVPPTKRRTKNLALRRTLALIMQKLLDPDAKCMVTYCRRVSNETISDESLRAYYYKINFKPEIRDLSSTFFDA
ncbi:dynactin subunit 1-like isoform X2 [Oscarella lobularis]|uniref:dynactin subunit 1-like isoform X2 n=1 Tax=Oscarella lobularis TaxID=121494 RepID=UPI003313E03E